MTDNIINNSFDEALNILYTKFTILQLNTQIDYRTTYSNNIDKISQYLINDQDYYNKFLKIFQQMTSLKESNTELYIHNRRISFIKKSGRVVWFSFIQICDQQRSYIDYLKLG